MFESRLTGLSATVGDKGGLYEWSGGALSMVSVLPNGKPAPSTLTKRPEFGFENINTRNAISADGARVVWSTKPDLYERDMGLEKTVRLDVVQPKASGKAPAEYRARFQAASSDGRVVYFTDEQDLTADANGGAGSPDLYRCVIVEETAGEPSCQLTDIAPGADLQGTVAGISQDGSYVYFVADAALTAGAANGKCSNGDAEVAGVVCNLYVYHEGVIRLAAVLQGSDYPDWAGGSTSELGKLPVRVSPNGWWLAFMSRRSLTGYDNRDAHSGARDEEVFLYDAVAHSGEGRVVCASCNPTGARPDGVDFGELITPAGGGDRVWSPDTWIAADVPAWTPYELGFAQYQSRYLSDSGRLFFNSHDGLVGRDNNDAYDVYEFEPSGVGDCGSASQRFVVDESGCVGLISSGASSAESAFLDASESGSDVFFLTAAKLWPNVDRDSSFDVYDAHECSVGPACVAEPPQRVEACEGEGCQAPVIPPAVLTPASFTFTAEGNVHAGAGAGGAVAGKSAKGSPQARKLAGMLRACHKKRVKRKRVACERNARRAVAKKRVKR